MAHGPTREPGCSWSKHRTMAQRVFEFAAAGGNGVDRSAGAHQASPTWPTAEGNLPQAVDPSLWSNRTLDATLATARRFPFQTHQARRVADPASVGRPDAETILDRGRRWDHLGALAPFRPGCDGSPTCVDSRLWWIGGSATTRRSQRWTSSARRRRRTDPDRASWREPHSGGSRSRAGDPRIAPGSLARRGCGFVGWQGDPVVAGAGVAGPRRC